MENESGKLYHEQSVSEAEITAMDNEDEETTNPEEQDSIENINKYMIPEQSFEWVVHQSWYDSF